MAPDSVLIIDDVVMPSVGATWKQTQKDMQMMACLAAVERSETQWTQLLEAAGLSIRETCIYDPDMRDGVIVAVTK